MVHDVMRHTAGFVYSGAAKSPRIKELYERGNIESSEKDITGDEMLKALGKIPLAYQPGTTWFYSIAVDVLGLLVGAWPAVLLMAAGLAAVCWRVSDARRGSLRPGGGGRAVARQPR